MEDGLFTLQDLIDGIDGYLYSQLKNTKNREQRIKIRTTILTYIKIAHTTNTTKGETKC